MGFTSKQLESGKKDLKWNKFESRYSITRLDRKHRSHPFSKHDHVAGKYLGLAAEKKFHGIKDEALFFNRVWIVFVVLPAPVITRQAVF